MDTSSVDHFDVVEEERDVVEESADFWVVCGFEEELVSVSGPDD